MMRSVVLVLCAGSALASVVQMPVIQTALADPGEDGPNRRWESVAASNNGERLVAVDQEHYSVDGSGLGHALATERDRDRDSEREPGSRRPAPDQWQVHDGAPSPLPVRLHRAAYVVATQQRCLFRHSRSRARALPLAVLSSCHLAWLSQQAQ